MSATMSAMRFPTPYFDQLEMNFRADPRSIHLCTAAVSGGEPAPPDTSGIRMSEALCIACGLVADRARLATSSDRQMLDKYGYKANLCSHGMAQNARDLANFLLEQWGRPTETIMRSTARPALMEGKTGLVAFIDIDVTQRQDIAAGQDGTAAGDRRDAGAQGTALGVATPEGPDNAAAEAGDRAGPIADKDGQDKDGQDKDGQCHIDLWLKDRPAGHAYWRCRKVLFWKLD